MRVLACFIVLLPLLAAASADTIAGKIDKDPRFTILRKLLKATGMDTTLGGSKNYTLFAPTDAAFKKLPEEALKAILEDEDHIGSMVMVAHVLAEKYGVISFANGVSAPGEPLRHQLKMFSDSYLTTVCERRGLVANGAFVTGELYASNGTVLIVDTVMPLVIDSPRPNGVSRSAPEDMFDWGLAKYFVRLKNQALPPTK